MQNIFTLYYQSWEQTLPKQKEIFVRFFAGDEKRAQTFYKRFFLCFNIVHECTHAIRCARGIRSSHYEEERAANLFAVAFFRFLKKEDFLKQVQKDVEDIWQNLPSLHIDNEASYFNQNYQHLSQEPSQYGYFQLRFLKDAFAWDKNIFETLSHVFSYEVDSFKEPIAEVEVKMDASYMVRLCMKVVRQMGLEVPKIRLRQEVSPNIQYITST